MILEKAYAKLFGGYHKIVQGNLDQALQDLTGGLCERQNFSQWNENRDYFWKELQHYSKSGFLVGAGTTKTPYSTQLISENGIAQGKLYSVIDCVEIDQYRLVKLQAPFQTKDISWNGDWSDYSFKWTSRLQKKLKFVQTVDGVFWMSFADLLYEFEYLLINRIFYKQLWSMNNLKGSNQQRKLVQKLTKDSNILQFEIRIDMRSNLFISIDQQTLKNMYTAKVPLWFCLLRHGKGVGSMKQLFENVAGRSGPFSDEKYIFKKLKADIFIPMFENLLVRMHSPHSPVKFYPHKFTLLIKADFNENVKADEAVFDLKIFCNQPFNIKKI